ncbi:MAG: TMEM175 family protein [Thermoanaerobaculia bacterium]
MKREHEVTRLEAFSDAVFAFAATLLVVSLEVPASFAELVRALSGFAPFALSFGALCAIWSVHNAYFRRYGLQDRTTIALTCGLLFVVLFYVFPLKFLTRAIVAGFFGIGREELAPMGGQELAQLFELYGAGFVAVFACVALMYAHAARVARSLELSARRLHEARMLARHYGIFCLVGGLSMALAATGVGLRFGAPGWIYALIGPLAGWHGAWSGRHRPAA